MLMPRLPLLAGLLTACYVFNFASLFHTYEYHDHADQEVDHQENIALVKHEKQEVVTDTAATAAIKTTTTTPRLLPVGNDKMMMQWSRAAVDVMCPMPNDSLRPNPSGADTATEVVPGLVAKDNPNSKTNNLQIQFWEDGVVGPLRSSMSNAQLKQVFRSLVQHATTVQRATKKRRRSYQTPSEKYNDEQLYGKRDVLMSRCYASNKLCQQLAQDPAIVDVVQQIIGDSVVVWSMDPFAKSHGSIQPWHTDIEPYDNCYGKNVQIWLAVEGVTANSTLEVMSKSHRMPSLTWLYPEHVLNAQTIQDKKHFQQTHLEKCAQNIQPNARILKPVTQNGEYMLFHSNMWHAAQVQGQDRHAIRITYSTPDCHNIRAVSEYQRPDIPPLTRPIAAFPPVLAVVPEGTPIQTWPNSNILSHNFLHLQGLPAHWKGQKDFEKRKKICASKKTTTEIQVWTKEEIQQQVTTKRLKDGTSRTKAVVMVGNTPLLDSLELLYVFLNADESAHPSPDTHAEGEIRIVLDGSVRFYKKPANATADPLDLVPVLAELSPGGLAFSDSFSVHNDIGGGTAGGWYFVLKFYPKTPILPVGVAAPDTHMFVPPQLDLEAVDGQTFFDRPNFGNLERVRGFTCRCVHKPHTDHDHEVLVLVEYVPPGVELFSLPDNRALQVGVVMYYPLHSTHGIEARSEDGGIIPYRNKKKTFEDVPRCLIIELYAPQGVTATSDDKKKKKKK